MTTLERLQTILVDEYKLPRASLTAHAHLEELGVDSLGALELFFKVEDEFRISVPNDPIPLNTVGEIVQYIDRLIAEQHGGRSRLGTAS
jgi:acyl carrier protein